MYISWLTALQPVCLTVCPPADSSGDVFRGKQVSKPHSPLPIQPAVYLPEPAVDLRLDAIWTFRPTVTRACTHPDRTQFSLRGNSQNLAEAEWTSAVQHLKTPFTLLTCLCKFTWFCWSGWTSSLHPALFCSGWNHLRCRCVCDPAWIPVYRWDQTTRLAPGCSGPPLMKTNRLPLSAADWLRCW